MENVHRTRKSHCRRAHRGFEVVNLPTSKQSFLDKPQRIGANCLTRKAFCSQIHYKSSFKFMQQSVVLFRLYVGSAAADNKVRNKEDASGSIL